MKNIIGEIVATFSSRIISLMRNRQLILFNREELRNLKFTFSAYGEDIVVLSYFNWFKHEDQDSKKRIYVDVGAYHPSNLSTTLLMSKLGWKGVNIDLDPEKIELFKQARPHDQNVVAAISDQRKTVRHLKYPLGTTNRIAEITQTNFKSICNEEPQEITEIETVTLTEILDNSPFHDRKIDYLNVDCEGHDFEVLKGLDYQRYAPYIITVEAHTADEQKVLKKFLAEMGYELTAILRYTLVFKKI